MREFLRGVNQSLIIDQEVEVTVLEIQEHCVRLGINAPNEFPSYWEETLFLEGPDVGSDLEFAESLIP